MKKRCPIFPCLFAITLLCAQDAAKKEPAQGFTGYPPLVYMQVFLACPSDTPCVKTDSFLVDSVPHGCCVLSVTNGDGHGTDEAQSYEVFLNGKKVASGNISAKDGANVKISRRNQVKVIFTGKPHSKLWVMVSYDPRQPN